MEVMVCGTTVQIEQVGKSQRVHENGRNTGALRFSVTNLETGTSVLVNASGPGSFSSTDNPDGTTDFTFSATGQNLIYSLDPLEEAILNAAGLPGLFVGSGPAEFNGTFNTDSGAAITFNVVNAPSRVRDLCAELT
jgi:hypothetical protein